MARRFAMDGGGSVSGVETLPSAARRDTLLVLAPGAGTDLSNPLLVAVADGLAAHGYPSVRFNFPYKERGGRAPDPAPVLEACYRAVLAQMRGAAARVVIGGKSMGGRMASHLAAQGSAVDGLLFLGYPLHPAGKPQQLRAAHLARIAAPMLFLAGTRDALCRLDLLRPVLAGLPRATLHVVDDADHSFAVRKSSGRDAAAVLDELLAASVAWLRDTVGA
ncbi:MAG: alpha/beta hydrolase family protein [Candidatus Binatia bacterium]